MSARARSTDPNTSHIAAVEAEAFAASHAGRILAVIKRTAEPLTAPEIGVRCSLTQFQVARRLPEMVRDELIEVADERNCSIHLRLMQTYRLRPEPEKQGVLF